MTVTHIVVGYARSSPRVWKIDPEGSSRALRSLDTAMPYVKATTPNYEIYSVAAGKATKKKFSKVQVTFEFEKSPEGREVVQYDADDWYTAARHENGDARVIAIKKGRETIATINAHAVIAVQGIS